MSISVPVFHKQFIGNTSSSTNEMNSPSFAAQGNRAVLNVTVRNIQVEAALKLQVLLQGSYDSKAWEDVSSSQLEFDVFDNKDVAVGSSGGTFDYAWVRVVARASGTETSTQTVGVLDANVVFSHQ